jgi:hypothetical protein
VRIRRVELCVNFLRGYFRDTAHEMMLGDPFDRVIIYLPQ